MKTCFAFLFLLLCPLAAAADNYVARPVHSDTNLSRITLPAEKEIAAILPPDTEDYNVVVNFLKTVEYTKGYVSKKQLDAYATVLDRLTTDNRVKLRKIADDFIASKNYKLTPVDLDNTDYNMPVRMLDKTP